jgi:putative ABC transport system ATP-binding protein
LLATCSLAVARARRAVATLDDFTLRGGEAALILGRSGSGKSTALFTLAGLAEPAAGEVFLEERAFSALPAAERGRTRGRLIGFVFQDMHLLAGLTVLENLLLAPFAAGLAQDRKSAEVLLDRLGLAPVAGRPAETLSRGEAQRAAVARAMLIDPRVILADEPTASLDDEAAGQVARLLLEAAAASGAALVIATHDQRLKTLIPGRIALHPVPVEAAA